VQILVVDDDDVGRNALAKVLGRFGYDVITATNGREALEVLAVCDCRLVISDWVMPEVNGPTLCRAIRDGEFSSYIYIILLTVRESHEDVIEGLTAGADDFMTKPFHPGELRVRIRAGERILSLETRDLTLFALAKLAESRDPEMGDHLERVRRYAKVLGEQLATLPNYRGVIDKEYVRLLFLTTPLHDIGKVAIKDAVLLKPGKLTADEYELMKSHTLKGAYTLQRAIEQHPEATFLKMARDIALTHHERYDGTGYPAGLAGDDIPLCGRIVALADVYDALTSKRIYKDAFDHETAHRLIVEGSGRQFDPDVVEAFLACEQEFLHIAECFSPESAVLV
jgi:putative two-component system response regulator